MTLTAPTLLDEVGISYDSFIEKMGIVESTAWRWRRDGMLKTTNILGRLYIMPEDLREFNRKAIAGDFAKEHKAPKKQKRLESEETSLKE